MAASQKLLLIYTLSCFTFLSVLPFALSSRLLVEQSSTGSDEVRMNKLDPELTYQVQVHAFLLWASMGFLMPVGILLIRMSGIVQCGKTQKVLFYLHVISQVASILLAIIAAIMSFIKFENAFNNTHQRIGLAVYLAVLLQPLTGFFRPNKGVRGRGLWYVVHWALGKGVCIFGIISIYTGLHAYHRKTWRSSRLWTHLFSAEIALLAILYLLQDRWHHIKKQEVDLGVQPVDASIENPSSREDSKELPVSCHESTKFSS